MERRDAKGFVEDFNRTYEEMTELRRIFGHRFYGSSSESDDADEKEEEEEGTESEYDDDDLSYFQVGRRTALPVSLVVEGRYAYVSDAVVGALCEGEKSFVAEYLSHAADEDEIPTVECEPTRIVETAMENVESMTPDHVLLPRTETYDEAVARWKDEGRLRKFGDSSYLRGPDGDEESEADCWLYRYDATPDVSDAFVLEDGGVTVVQKKGEDALPPTGFGYVAEYEDLNDDMPLMVYFGEERRAGEGSYDEFFDIVYRVVLSEPVVREGRACRISSV